MHGSGNGNMLWGYAVGGCVTPGFNSCSMSMSAGIYLVEGLVSLLLDMLALDGNGFVHRQVLN